MTRSHAIATAYFLCLTVVTSVTARAQEKPAEVWSGTLEAGPQQIKMQFRIFEKDGTRSGLLDVISQGANDIPFEIKQDDADVTYDIKLIQSKYAGKVNDAQNTIEGHWIQGGVQFPFKLTKAEKATSPDDLWNGRPQFPRAPFPYEIREVTCHNATDAITLAGTLTLPKRDGPHPAVILISGSGPQDRDETLMGHKPFAVLADHLSRKGIAVLRMDDRGIGQSEGEFANATTEDFTRDIEAGIDYLKTVSEIDAKKIGLMGHSEGGLVAPIIAARRGDVAFIVLLAGPGVTGQRIVETQSALILRAEGVPEEKIKLNRKFLDAGLEVIRSLKEGDDIHAKLSQEVDRLIAEMDENSRPEYEAAKEQIIAGLGPLTNPWFKYFMEYDPQPALTKVTCPVLAVNGAKDLQVPADENLQAIENALKAAGNQDFEVAKLEGLNHLFQTAGTGSPSEYIKIDETFAPAALKKISEWIRERTQ